MDEGTREDISFVLWIGSRENMSSSITLFNKLLAYSSRKVQNPSCRRALSRFRHGFPFFGTLRPHCSSGARRHNFISLSRLSILRRRLLIFAICSLPRVRESLHAHAPSQFLKSPILSIIRRQLLIIAVWSLPRRFSHRASDAVDGFTVQRLHTGNLSHKPYS